MRSPLVLLVFAAGCGKEPMAAPEATPSPLQAYLDTVPSLRPANQLIDLENCRFAGTPKGKGHVTVTFDEDGKAKKAEVDDPVFANTHTGWCVAQRYRKEATGVGTAEATFRF